MEMFCFVERVSYTAPQAQRIVVGWIIRMDTVFHSHSPHNRLS